MTMIRTDRKFVESSGVRGVPYRPTKDERAWLELRVHPPTVAKALLCVVVFLIVAGTVANIVIYHVAPDPDPKLRG